MSLEFSDGTSFPSITREEEFLDAQKCLETCSDSVESNYELISEKVSELEAIFNDDKGNLLKTLSNKGREVLDNLDMTFSNISNDIYTLENIRYELLRYRNLTLRSSNAVIVNRSDKCIICTMQNIISLLQMMSNYALMFPVTNSFIVELIDLISYVHCIPNLGSTVIIAVLAYSEFHNNLETHSLVKAKLMQNIESKSFVKFAEVRGLTDLFVQLLNQNQNFSGRLCLLVDSILEVMQSFDFHVDSYRADLVTCHRID
jgi:hypothetical protein